MSAEDLHKKKNKIKFGWLEKYSKFSFSLEFVYNSQVITLLNFYQFHIDVYTKTHLLNITIHEKKFKAQNLKTLFQIT